jgi:NitT/TauT family transport system substrate-binding protein
MARPIRLASALLCAVALVTSCGTDEPESDAATAAGADSNELKPLQVACAPAAEHLPRQLAISEGFNEDNGVDPTCVDVPSGPAQAAALLSGNLDLAFLTQANIAPLFDKKQELAVVGSIRNNLYFDLVVQKDFDLPSESDGWEGVMKDLEGARIGVVARGAAAEVITRALFEAAGVDPDKQTYIATGLPNTTLAALSGNTVDAAMTLEPGITLALEQGIAKQPFSLQEGTGPDGFVYDDQLMLTSRKFAESNKEVLCDYRTAWDQALEYMRDPENEQTVEAEAAELLGLPAPTVSALLERTSSFFPETTALEAESVEAGFAFLAENGAAQTAYELDDIAVEVC